MNSADVSPVRGRVTEIIRWLVMLPGALLAFAVVSPIAVQIKNMVAARSPVKGFDWSFSTNINVFLFFQSLIGTAAGIVVAVSIAPRSRKRVALILGISLIALFWIYGFGTSNKPVRFQTYWDKIRIPVMGTLGSVIGVGIALFLHRREDGGHLEKCAIRLAVPVPSLDHNAPAGTGTVGGTVGCVIVEAVPLTGGWPSDNMM